MKAVLCTLNAKYIHSSLALLYLKHYCEGEGWQIETMEFTINQPLDDIRTRLYLSRPDLLSFSCYIWNIEPTLTLCRDLKQLLPECIFILGGPEVSFDASPILADNPAIQIIVRGEGENTLKEVLSSLQQGGSLRGVAGITYRDDGGLIINNPDRELIQDLNLLPPPYRGDLSAYSDRLVYYESSRGCPFNCSYCLSSTFKGVRTLPLDRVKSDLDFLIRSNIKSIKFVDRTFNANEKRAMDIMEHILLHNSSTRFHFEIMADLISEEFMSFLLQVPPDVFGFEIGVQSTFPPALKAVDRRYDLERIYSNVGRLSAAGNIHLHLDLIAGLPFEHYSDFKASFNKVYKLYPDEIQLGFLKMLKGSRLRDEASEYGYIFQQHPPYMVLESNYMKYDEFILLSNLEKLLDRYYNSGEFKSSLIYIQSSLYEGDAFAFFEKLAIYSESKGWFLEGHNRRDEFNLLAEFAEDMHHDWQFSIKEYLRYDFIMNNRHNPLPEKLLPGNYESPKNTLNDLLKNRSFIESVLPEWADLSKYELTKRMQLAYFSFDPTSKNPVYGKTTPLLFVYPANQRKASRVIRL